MKKALFIARAVHGRLEWASAPEVQRCLCRVDGCELEITIGKKRNRKNSGTTRQLRYYWGVIIDMIAEEMGETRENADLYLRMMFHFDEINGVKIPKSLKNTMTNTIEREEYFSSCRQWANEFFDNMWIPKPNEADGWE